MSESVTADERTPFGDIGAWTDHDKLERFRPCNTAARAVDHPELLRDVPC
jgi:hypothetical protein